MGRPWTSGGRSLLTNDEVDRIEYFYGKVDPESHRVKTGRLSVPIRCDAFPGFYTTQTIWIWDWGRNEPPTEPQFRKIERDTDCSDRELRGTMASVFEEAKKNKVPFSDLLNQRIKTAREDLAIGRQRR